MNPKSKYYVVWKGRHTGLFATWDECAAAVQGFTGAQFMSFESRAAAEAALSGTYAQAAAHRQRQAGAGAAVQRAAVGGPLRPAVAVDAACSGNPGRLEYRAVDLSGEKILFHEGPFEEGTNNIGEFLAIVQALALLDVQGSSWPIYSDSTIAIGWVRQKKCRTRLARTPRSAPLFDRIAAAERWLIEHTFRNQVLKWETAAWGEIPADFGRK